ncbi:hypothetical protein BVI1335_320108 [Burkholderia vietnamiensis]|nr:hypothetical protein BVI1335_320108 [Burkholderia vietnamiensis]
MPDAAAYEGGERIRVADARFADGARRLRIEVVPAAVIGIEADLRSRYAECMPAGHFDGRIVRALASATWLLSATFNAKRKLSRCANVCDRFRDRQCVACQCPVSDTSHLRHAGPIACDTESSLRSP